MTNQLKNFIKGIGKVLEIYPHQNYIIPQRGDFRRDMHRLRGDAKKVAANLRTTVNLYDQQIYKP